MDKRRRYAVLDLADDGRVVGVVALAPGTGHPPYHWRHGYIPLTPAAALSKAKGNRGLASRYESRFGVGSGPTSEQNPLSKLPTHELQVYANASVYPESRRGEFRTELQRRGVTPEKPSKTASGITIEHTGDGTLVHGTTREDAPTLKKHGFKWSRNLQAWYLPRTWGYNTRQHRVDNLKRDLPDAEVQGTPERSTTAAERFAQRQERAGQRAERLTQRSGRLEAEADAQFKRAHDIVATIPMGQPILVGHHSERRHRRDLEKSNRADRKGLEAHREAKRTAEAAKSAEAGARLRESVPGIRSRLERNEAELRKLERAAGDRFNRNNDRFHARINDLRDEISHDRQMLDQAEKSGAKIYRQSDFKPGDMVKIGGQWREVSRSNPKTVGVYTTGFYEGHTLNSPHHKVTGHVPREQAAERFRTSLSKLDPADAASRANKLGPGLRASLHASGWKPAGYTWQGDKLVRSS